MARSSPRSRPDSSPAEGLTYRPIPAPDREVRELFGFVGAWAPPDSAVISGWGAWVGERLVGALLLEKSGSAGMLHGPVVIAPPVGIEPGDAPAAGGPSPQPVADAPTAEAATGAEAIDIAAHLLSDALEDTGARGIDTVFTRPQGLDPVWVRLGFIPVPEVELPKGLRGRPGVGLFAWRGGSALWSSSGRNAVPAASRSRR